MNQYKKWHVSLRLTLKSNNLLGFVAKLDLSWPWVCVLLLVYLWINLSTFLWVVVCVEMAKMLSATRFAAFHVILCLNDCSDIIMFYFTFNSYKKLEKWCNIFKLRSLLYFRFNQFQSWLSGCAVLVNCLMEVNFYFFLCNFNCT